MNSRLVISLLCAGALAFACGPRSHSDAPPTHAVKLATAATTRPDKHSKKAKVPPDIRLASKFAVQPGAGAVHLVLDVTSIGSHSAELTFPDGQAYDFVVVDSVGREVWRWANGRMFTQALQNRLLSAGETMHVDEKWSQPKRGKYTAIATLRSSNHPVEQRADFLVH